MTKKVLIAEDDPNILEAIKIILEMSGYSVETTSIGVDIEQLIHNLPDVILLDIRMSGIDGRFICKQLKADARTKDIPIIMISASRELETASKECNANGFLAKPFEMNDLLETVENALKKENA